MGARRVLCHVCGWVLDPVLPASGYLTHPCCDPEEEPLTRGYSDHLG